MNVKYSVCNRRTDRKYINQECDWKALVERNRTPVRTSETAEEYAKFPKPRRDAIKDIGGMVGGWLRGGVRKNGNVICRSIGLLDADHIRPDCDFCGEVNTAYGNLAYFIYSTHSHTPETPRYRFVVLFSREVSEDEYPALMRMAAKKIGMDYFDDSTYQANRMMYWASCPSNGEFVFQENAGEPLDVDSVLAMYADWRDVSQWPTSSRQSEAIKHEAKTQKNPLEKDGIVGAFCRAYPNIQDAIEEFLPDVYEPTAYGRYNYIPGESTAGVVIYDDVFAYSHHATDPACGKLLNAFDLVRVHRFRDMDEKKSFAAMAEFAVQLDKVKLVIAADRERKAAADFEAVDDWKTLLQYQKRGNVLENSVWNETLILNNDPDFANFAYNEMANRIQVTGPVPWERPRDNPFWRDADTAQLKVQLDTRYLPFSSRNHDVSFIKVADDRRFHPVRDYLDGLPEWDGVPRVSTLFIDYFGAESTSYVRAVCRKSIVAAVARIYEPGIKFDNVTILNGPQGIGKSTLYAKLAGQWFSDSLTLTDMKDKAGAEKLQGYWILELGELSGMRKTDVEVVKSFISRVDDQYRPSYGKTVESHPRQCIIVGTTNAENGFLRDITGNRRFWPVRVSGSSRKKSWELTQGEVDQIWAEAKHLYEQGEKLFLEGDEAAQAVDEQVNAMETDERQGMVEDYLNTLLPENWNTLDIYERRSYITEKDSLTAPAGTVRRDSVSNAEIWCECFGRALADMNPTDSYAVAALMSKVPGWVRSPKIRKLPNYGRQRVYLRTEKKITSNIIKHRAQL